MCELTLLCIILKCTINIIILTRTTYWKNLLCGECDILTMKVSLINSWGTSSRKICRAKCGTRIWIDHMNSLSWAFRNVGCLLRIGSTHVSAWRLSCDVYLKKKWNLKSENSNNGNVFSLLWLSKCDIHCIESDSNHFFRSFRSR